MTTEKTEKTKLSRLEMLELHIDSLEKQLKAKRAALAEERTRDRLQRLKRLGDALAARDIPLEAAADAVSNGALDGFASVPLDRSASADAETKAGCAETQTSDQTARLLPETTPTISG